MCASFKSSEQNTNLKEKLDDLTKLVVGLEKKIDDLKAKRSENGGLKKEIDDLKAKRSENGGLTKKIEDLEANNLKAKNDIDDLEANNLKAKNDIDDLKAKSSENEITYVKQYLLERHRLIVATDNQTAFTTYCDDLSKTDSRSTLLFFLIFFVAVDFNFFKLIY